MTSTSKATPTLVRAGSRATESLFSPLVERLLTVGEVARLLRVSRNTVYALVRRGDLPGILVGSQVRVHSRGVARFAQRQSLRALRPRAERRRRRRHP